MTNKNGQRDTILLTAVRLHRPAGGSSTQLVEQCLCFFQIGRVETLGEPAVDRREEIAGFGMAGLAATEPSEAHGGAQLPELGLLFPGDAQGSAIHSLGG